jgi:hypothetical protein
VGQRRKIHKICGETTQKLTYWNSFFPIEEPPTKGDSQKGCEYGRSKNNGKRAKQQQEKAGQESHPKIQGAVSVSRIFNHQTIFLQLWTTCGGLSPNFNHRPQQTFPRFVHSKNID